MFIDDIELKVPVLFAPMAGVSDFPYRQIIRKMGCKLTYTEMVSSKGLTYGSSKTDELIDFSREKGFIGVQIFGEEPEIMAEAALMIEEKYNPDIIDINMGCPANKIVKNGAGAALMKNPVLAGNIVKAVVNAVNLPVTVKTRKGWNLEQINAVEIAKIAENMGAKAVTIHGRTREQFYQDNADWQIIGEVKKSIKIPVIGNGDVFTPEDAANMLVETGCDGIMVARGAQGNPWLFKRITTYLNEGRLLPEPDLTRRIQMIIYHLEQAVKYYGERYAVPKMRKHIAWYLKGQPHSSRIRQKVNQLISKKQIIELLNDYVCQFTNFQHPTTNLPNGS